MRLLAGTMFGTAALVALLGLLSLSGAHLPAGLLNYCAVMAVAAIAVCAANNRLDTTREVAAMVAFSMFTIPAIVVIRLLDSAWGHEGGTR